MKTLALFLLATTLALADPPEPRFTAVTLDDKIQIGYGLAVADVDGDGHPDILLADKRQIVWYRNPGPDKARDPAAWRKFLIAENLTEHDNVCLAAQDLDGDGKCELAVGAEWNPGDTEHSGAVFYLLPPADRTQRWEPVKFPSVEPTTHRMRWLKMKDGSWGLAVVPLHGRGNKNGEGAPVKVLLYHPPSPLNDPKGEWKSEVVDESMHMTHNVLLTAKWHAPMDDEILLAGKEGVKQLHRRLEGTPDSFGRTWYGELLESESTAGAGELRDGWLLEKGGLFSRDKRWLYYATIEPMHGNRLVVTPQGPLATRGDKPQRHVLTDKLIEGHALACGDLLGVKSDQIVVGWRGNPAKPDNTFGIRLWTPLDATGEHWRESAVDDGGLACEDLQLADLDGDGRPDIAASGRATHNVKLYFNDTPR